MSKIGKKNITVPKDSSVKSENGVITVTGPKGSKQLTVNDKVFSTKVSRSKISVQLTSTKYFDNTLCYEDMLTKYFRRKYVRRKYFRRK